VFVAGGRHRSHAVRLAAIALGLLLAGWLAAIAAGLIGFSALPELTLSRPGGAGTPPAPPHHVIRPMAHDAGGAQASPAASRQARGSVQATAGSAADLGGAGETQQTGGNSGSVGGGPPSPGGVSAAPQPHPTSPPGGATAPDEPGQPPSFTPRASGEQAASPPRGSSSSAPGNTTSADPPGKATGSPSG
jgi:hypothetical protein